MSSRRDTEIVLYRHVGCPFCERVVRILEGLDVDYISRFVVPQHSERDHIKEISGERKVPLLLDENRGVTMTESANIVEYLETEYGDRK